MKQLADYMRRHEPCVGIARITVFTAVKIQVKVVWVVTSCSIVVGYHCFRRSSKTLVSYLNTTWCHNPEDLDLNMLVLTITGEAIVNYLGYSRICAKCVPNMLREDMNAHKFFDRWETVFF
jgi:hypothetical protein